MKRSKNLTLANILLLFSFTAIGAYASSDDEARIAAVLAANQDRSIALVAHDLEALNRILAPDFSYTHSGGQVETKELHIGTLEDGLRYTKFETTELRANVITPDVVTLNGIFHQIKSRKGTGKERSYLFLSVWRRTGDSWQVTSWQSALPPARK